MKRHWTEQLEKLNACREAIEWARAYPSLDAAWADCRRGDWMAWLASRCSGVPESPARKTLVLALCEIARKVLHFASPEEDRPRVAIETAESWARGEATIEEVRAAHAAAYASHATAYAAASHAAYAAYVAYDAAAYVAYVADAYVAYVADATTRSPIADIMRKHYPTPPMMQQ